MNLAAFDSGVGGLIALAPIIRANPGIQISYLGDLANLPYGTKSPNRIKELTKENIQGLFDLTKQKFDLLLLACNTASAHSLDLATSISTRYNTPCVGVIDPGCDEALRIISQSQNSGRIVILGTTATIKSQIYPKTLREKGFQGEILSVAAPLFVPLVESGFENTVAAECAVEHYLKSVLKPGDTVILGCTHYPLLKQTLIKIFPFVSNWVEAGEALIHSSLLSRLKSDNKSETSHVTVYLTDSTVDSKNILDLFSKLNISKQMSWDLKFINPFV